MCKLFYFVQSLNYTCSIIILTVISLERYMAINYPMTCKRFSRSRILRCCVVAGVWLASIAYSMPLLFIYSTFHVPPLPNADVDDDGDVYCIRLLPSNSRITTIYVMVDLFLFYLLPLLLMLVVYTKIAVVLWRSSSIEQNLSWTRCSFHFDRRTRTSRGSLRNPSSFARTNETFENIAQTTGRVRGSGQAMFLTERDVNSRKVSYASTGSEPFLAEGSRKVMTRAKSVSNPELREDIAAVRSGDKDSASSWMMISRPHCMRNKITVDDFGTGSRSSVMGFGVSTPRITKDLTRTSGAIDEFESSKETSRGVSRPSLTLCTTRDQQRLNHSSGSSARLSLSTYIRSFGSSDVETKPNSSSDAGAASELLMVQSALNNHHHRKSSSLCPATPIKDRLSVSSARLSTSSVAQCRSSSSRHKNPLLYRRKVIRLLIVMVIAFGICMLPHHVRIQWQEWSNVSDYTQELMFIPPFTTLLFYINSCLNPFLYALISNKFRKSFRELRCNRRVALGERFTIDTGR